MSDPADKLSRYQALVEHLFLASYKRGTTRIEFDRTELESAATALDMKLPKNLGDVIYWVRYRTKMPASILATQPDGMEWIIEGIARSRYAFCLGHRLIKPHPDADGSKFH